MSDSELVRAARAGSKAALGSLLERHQPLLLALCRRVLGDPGAAEDAAQETLLQALLSLDRLRDARRLGPWLAGFGLNVCRRRLRARTREAWSWDALQGGGRVREPLDRGTKMHELAEAAELAAQVRRAIAELPPGQRAAVLLFYLAGLSQAEVAAQLGIEVGTVKTRLHKARGTLRQRLWVLWEEERMAGTRAEPAIEVRVADVHRTMSQESGHHRHAVMLQEVGGLRRLPLWIGQVEATALALQLGNVQVPRPLTFTLMANLLAALGGRLRAVRIDRLVDTTFYAVAEVEGPTGGSRVDARPSDALNLALLTGARIYVEPRVFAALGVEGTACREELQESSSFIADARRELIAEWQREKWRGHPPGSPEGL